MPWTAKLGLETEGQEQLLDDSGAESLVSGDLAADDNAGITVQTHQVPHGE